MKEEGYEYVNCKNVVRTSNQEVLIREDLSDFLLSLYPDVEAIEQETRINELAYQPAKLKMEIIVKLHEFGYPPIMQDEVCKNMLEQAENFKKNR